MKRVITSEKLPIKLWVDYLEDKAEQQAKNLANLPFAFRHIAIMSDAHSGYGMPIGGVLATKDFVIPNAVGVDIGCGMCSVKTSLAKIDKEVLKNIMGEIRRQIPLGFEHHRREQNPEFMPAADTEKTPVVRRELMSARKQVGTLGGGNHFIEIQKGSDGHIWIMIHSGSRNLGKQVADYYNKLAVSLNEKWHSSVPKSWELASLPVESPEGETYLKEMQYCVDFALANRRLIMERILEIFRRVAEAAPLTSPVSGHEKAIINIAHNYAKLENHFGEDVWVHRKGATLATRDTIGIVPGSQGSKSYIVRGKSNPESFNSCSHGAGRKMGRKEAERKLNLEEEIKKLDERGILHAVRGVHDLDEAAGAYKDISQVMENQKDLVEILVELEPLAVVKG